MEKDYMEAYKDALEVARNKYWESIGNKDNN